MVRILRCLALLSLAMLAAPPLAAQTTDAYRSVQVFPVVVDSASFTQRFTFRAPESPTTLQVRFYRGDVDNFPLFTSCGSHEIGVNATFASLRDLCTSLPAGSVFGTLMVVQTSGTRQGFAAFSRVSNPQGNGFSVEAFGLESFPGFLTTQRVTGLRRLAATGSSPAFQTNCFIGELGRLNSSFSVNREFRPVSVSLRANGQTIGGTGMTLEAGSLYRLLDVFAALNVPPGDVPDAQLIVSSTQSFNFRDGALVVFCTVQDNTSFGADFRIGKAATGVMDYSALHDSSDSQEAFYPGVVEERVFNLGAGAVSNAHVISFKHPDTVSCQLHVSNGGAAMVQADGVEMRLVDDNGAVIAGGNDATGFGPVYLGDKPARYSGTSGHYVIEVESNGTNTGASRPYSIRCKSGSGHTRPDLFRYHVPGTMF